MFNDVLHAALLPSALSSCMCLGAVFDLLGALATGLFGIPVAPTFNRPWMVSPHAGQRCRNTSYTLAWAAAAAPAGQAYLHQHVQLD
jgi:hypothetical protein